MLILIHPAADGEAHLTLIERAGGDYVHAGQISLPGGAIEAGETTIEAALREAQEEVNLDVAQAGVHVVGELPASDVTVSGYRVHPVVAFADRPARGQPRQRRDCRRVQRAAGGLHPARADRDHDGRP